MKVTQDSVYSAVHSFQSLRTIIFLAEHNRQKLWGADIGSAYLEAKNPEKCVCVAGDEFGDALKGHLLIIDKALYGVPGCGKAFAEHLGVRLRAEGFTPSLADPCIWMRPAGDVYEYVATWVDDLCIVMNLSLIHI